MHVVLLTAKGGNQSIADKNLIAVGGRSMVGHMIHAARGAERVARVFVSTECPRIAECAVGEGAEVIARPAELARPDTNHGDVIIHGAKAIAEKIGAAPETVTVLLGNTVMTRAEDIDRAIDAVAAHPEADSAMTVWLAQDDHPYRAMRIGSDGYLHAFLERPGPTDTNRQSYPPVHFYDQGPWTVRYSTLLAAPERRDGPACWWWMGARCLPLPRLWVTGKDVHTQLDVEISRAWLENELWRIQ